MDLIKYGNFSWGIEPKNDENSINEKKSGKSKKPKTKDSNTKHASIESNLINNNQTKSETDSEPESDSNKLTLLKKISSEDGKPPEIKTILKNINISIRKGI